MGAAELLKEALPVFDAEALAVRDVVEDADWVLLTEPVGVSEADAQHVSLAQLEDVAEGVQGAPVWVAVAMGARDCEMEGAAAGVRVPPPVPLELAEVDEVDLLVAMPLPLAAAVELAVPVHTVPMTVAEGGEHALQVVEELA